MRSLIVGLLPVLALSFGVVACGDEAEVPPPAVEQQQQEQNEAKPEPLGAEGASCTSDSACESGLVCSLSGATVRTRGLPIGEESVGDDDDDDSNDDVQIAPAPKGKPTDDSAVLAGRCAARR